MSKLSKISQSNEAKELFDSPLVNYLKFKRSKAEMAAFLNCSPRRAREVASMVAMYYPVIAVSDGQGYRRAKSINELNDSELLAEMNEVRHQLRETNSRIKCLKKKQKPLIAWLKVAEKKLKERDE